MKSKKLHMVGNAHIDPVWLWQWQEGFHEVKATFRSALDRMNEYPDFKFVASSAAFYEWVEQSSPDMFAEIQQRVREGRWVVVGGWWVEPDCNIPGGESFARHALYAQRFFKRAFGITAKVGYAVDSFGHNGMLPQLLKKGGLPYYVFMRPMPFEKGLPGSLFWWEADDGSRVLTLRLPFEYLSWGKDLEHHIQRCAGEMKAPIDEFVCFYGVGNHGGGPTKSNIESIHRLNKDPNLPDLVFSDLESFFTASILKGWSLPVVHTDLQHHSSGCYSSHSGIKRWVRQAENRLMAAEKWSLVSAWSGIFPYPQDFTHAWKNVLFNEFHDILAGTSLEAAYNDARDSFGEAFSIADRNLNLALQSLAWQIKIDEIPGSQPFVVFNPNTFKVDASIEIENKPVKAGSLLLDETGSVVPHQSLRYGTIPGQSRLAFNTILPPLGYRTFHYFPETPEEVIPLQVPVVLASESVLENDFLRLEFDPQTGCIASLLDKRAGVQVFSGPAAYAVVLEDVSDTWGHNIFKWDKIAGNFKAVTVQLLEHGPVKSVIRVFSKYAASTLVQDFNLTPTSARIEVRATVNWNEQLKMLKLRFPVNVKFMKVTHEIPYGHIERFANGEEESAQNWVDVSGISRDREIPYGFSLLNDSKYSLDVNVQEIGLTVLRSPAYAHHIPAVLEPQSAYAYIDQGIQTFCYTLLPHTGGWEISGTVKEAAALNQKPIVMFATFHPSGILPQSDSFINVYPENIMVSVLKQAEDGDDLILRAYETTGDTTHAVIRLPKWGRVVETDFSPCEIKTIRIPRDASRPACETDFLEGLI